MNKSIPFLQTGATGAQINFSFFGAARVRKVGDNTVYLETPDAYAWATLATGFFYTPRIDDEVLALAQGNEWFVIGVLKQPNDCHVILPASLEISAPSASVIVRSGKEISLRSPVVILWGKTLHLIADTVTNRCKNLCQFVKDVITLRAGRSDQSVSGELRQSAGRIRQNAEGDIKLRGKTINLN